MAKKLISIATLFVLMAVSVFSAFAVEDETKNALVYGDVNIDGAVTVIDATDIQKYIVGLEEFTADSKSVADVDSDGIISVKGVTVWVQILLKVNFANP